MQGHKKLPQSFTPHFATFFEHNMHETLPLIATRKRRLTNSSDEKVVAKKQNQADYFFAPPMSTEDLQIEDRSSSSETKANQLLETIPSIFIATMLILMVCIPFGLALFPAEWEQMPLPREIGIQMFLFTTALSQIVYTFTSTFSTSIGLQMVENIPFYHSIALGIIRDVGATSPQTLPTIVVAYALSSILVGVLFFALGYFRLGSIMYFFPKHIILGAIGGIGIFVVQTGIQNATGVSVKWNLSSLMQLANAEILPLWLSALALVVLLSVLSKYIRSPFMPPIFFLSIPPAFYILLAILGVSSQDARASGWFFDRAAKVTFWTMWEPFQFNQVAWWAIPRQYGTILGLSLFSLMHVPINIPSLSLTTGTEVDINQELKSHGYSNALAGLCGSVQNYLCYSFSALYYKCGGNGFLSSICVAFITILIFLVGPNAVAYIPRCMAGCLMIHIGLDLMREAIIDTYQTLDFFEYCTVITITLSMALFGMNQGLAIGAVLACLTFVVQSVPKGPVRGSMSGATLRSNKWRTAKALDMLDELSRRVHVVQLQGHIFFANVNKLHNRLKNVLKIHEGHVDPIKYLILDFTLVIALDSSAADRLSKVKNLCNRHQCHLVFANIPSSYGRFRQQMIALYGNDKPYEFYDVNDLNAAMELCEDDLLVRNTIGRRDRDTFLKSPLKMGHSRSSKAHLRQLHALCPSESMDVLHQLLAYFSMQKRSRGEVLWKQGEKSTFAALLVSGSLRAEFEGEAGTMENISIGALIGDMCLLTGEKRKCTVVADEDSDMYILTYEKLQEMIKHDCKIAFLFQSISLRYTSFRLQYVGNRIWETKCIPI